jgi:hypothetical protein
MRVFLKRPVKRSQLLFQTSQSFRVEFPAFLSGDVRD